MLVGSVDTVAKAFGELGAVVGLGVIVRSGVSVGLGSNVSWITGLLVGSVDTVAKAFGELGAVGVCVLTVVGL